MIFLKLPNFLGSKVLNCLVAREATRIYKFITSNHASLRFTCSEKKICLTIQNSQNVMYKIVKCKRS